MIYGLLSFARETVKDHLNASRGSGGGEEEVDCPTIRFKLMRSARPRKKRVGTRYMYRCGSAASWIATASKGGL